MRNGSGSYSLPSGNPVNNGTTIDPTWANTTLTDIATALTQSISQDGQTPITNNLPMTGFKHTNVANAQSRNEYASAAQCQDNTFDWLTAVSGTDTITASTAIVMGAYAAGQCFRFVSSGANTTTSVTLNLNGIGAKAITKNGSTALAVGDIPSGAVVEVVYDGTRFQLVGTSVNHASTADSATSATTATNATSLTGTSTSNIPSSALGSGTADNTTFLRGDRTFQTIATMTATTGGLVPTPPNDVTQVLRGNGTFGAVSSLGRLYNIVHITAAGSGTYTKPANINRLLVRAIGAGGGGGGCNGSAGGGGGGSGGYGDLFITSPAASYAYTVGSGGAGGSGAGGNGGNGGATTIAGISAGGGAGGTGNTGSGNVAGGLGGSTSGGGTNTRGGNGSIGSSSGSGDGGNCVLAGGGAGVVSGTGGGGLTGAGGSGGGSSTSPGGAGGAGYIEIWEFE
jgi:hypothetical protein